MNRPSVIKNFSGKYKFLSNFYTCKVTYNNIEYNHSEGAFQAQKTLDEEQRKYIATLTASESKRACGKRGFKIELRPDWLYDKVRNEVMYEVVKAKFVQNKDLAQRLLDTGGVELIEGNTWHDNYWGDCTCERCKDIQGKNQLGVTLMQVRDELKQLNS